MDGYRAAGRVEAGEGCTALFRGLEGLERMVEAVRQTGGPPEPEPALLRLLRGDGPGGPAGGAPAAGGAGAPPKKAPWGR
jgi:hypothetical protein